jgi:hypothetical protein
LIRLTPGKRILNYIIDYLRKHYIVKENNKEEKVGNGETRLHICCGPEYKFAGNINFLPRANTSGQPIAPPKS